MKRLLAALLLAGLAPSQLFADYYISPSGSDSNPGTQAAPFATLVGARNAIRTVRAKSGLPAGGYTVWLRAGTYNLSSTVELDNIDGGASGSPVVFSAYPGELVYITGAAPLSPSGFSLVTNSSPVWSRLDPSAQGNLYSVSLPSQGVSNYGTIKGGGFELSVVAPLELFFNHQPMTLGRWPNANQTLARTVSVPASNQFTYSGTRPQRWTQAQDVWLHGLWGTTWADFHVDVSSINTSTSTITVASVPEFGFTGNSPYYAYNLLEEIDSPGEYYVDRSAGILYFWPPAPLAGSTIQVSMYESTLFALDSTQYIAFRNLTMEATRGPIFQINGGNNNSLVGCLLRNCGQYGVSINGTNSGVDQCELVDTGEDGVILAGGNRASLTAGNNFVTNSRFHRAGRINWSYHPAVTVGDSCGNSVSNNLIDELPHAAIIIQGNNHTISGNDVSRACQQTSDCGAIYSGRDWGYRGIAMTGNFVHQIENSPEGWNTIGILLDDLMSSAQVSGNVFYDISGAALEVGGGRDNIMTNNIMAQCAYGHFAGDYARNSVDEIPGDSFNLLERLATDGIQYQSPPWSTAYPACAAIPNSYSTIEQGLWRNPQGCVFSNNAGWSNTNWMTETDVSGTGVFAVYAAIANNNSSQAPLFTEAMSRDRSLRPATLTASVSGFTPIAFADIGPSIANPSAVVLPPPAPVLQVLNVTNSEVDVQWTDDGIHTEQQETNFELQRQNLPSGSWEVIQTTGADVDTGSYVGLAAATNYAFRIRSYNAVGSVFSNAVDAQTLAPTPVLVPGASTVVQANSPLTVLHDVHVNGTVNVMAATQLEGPSVAMFDVGDEISVSFTTSAGLYSVNVLARSGYTIAPTYYWPTGYQYTLDGDAITLVGNPATVTAFDPGDGGVFWGTMSGTPMTFTAGTHVLTITSRTPWALVNSVSISALVPAQITTFAQWQQANFSTDQIANAAISGPSATPANDGITNLMKYALGLNPWTAATGTGVQVTLASGEPQLTYTRPAALTDVTYFVEVSNDQNTWTALTQTTTGQSNGMLTRQATQTGAPSEFIRLRIVNGANTVSTGALSTGVAVSVVNDGTPLTVVKDVGVLGTVGVATDTVIASKCVRLYDIGDSINVSFTTAAGAFVVGARVRSGDAMGSTTFWPSGYTFALDGSPITLTGDPTTVSAIDPSFGPTYWGTMNSAPVTLTAGTHTLTITSAKKWAMAVSVDTVPAP